MLAAVALAAAGLAGSKTARKRAIVRAIKEVSYYLGNTPAVARASYIDPRIFDRFNDGLRDRPGDRRRRGDPARAVLDLIADDDDAEKLAEAEELEELVPAAEAA